MKGNTQTATTSKAAMQHRYTGIITYGNGQEVYLDSFYKTETAARNAVIRARARLTATGRKVSNIRTAVMEIHITGCSSPIRKGLYPTDYNESRDGWLSEYFK